MYVNIASDKMQNTLCHYFTWERRNAIPINTQQLRQNDHYFADDISDSFPCMKTVEFWILTRAAVPLVKTHCSPHKFKKYHIDTIDGGDLQPAGELGNTGMDN